MRFSRGHIDPWWNEEYKTLDYLYLPHTDKDMVPEWEAQGYAGMHLNGAVYGQNRDMPQWALKFAKIFPWDNNGVAAYCMNTGDILPVHSDHYISYKKMFNILNNNDVYRGVTFLEDWKSGHYFEIDGQAFTDWVKGDYVSWQGNIPHMACNMGREPRYTMQITGMRKL